MEETSRIAEKMEGMIETLEAGPGSEGAGTMILVSYGILIPVAAAVLYLEIVPWPDSLFFQVVAGIIILTAPLNLMLLLDSLKEDKLVKAVAAEYYESFPGPAEQLAANAVMLGIPAHFSKKPCIHIY